MATLHKRKEPPLLTALFRAYTVQVTLCSLKHGVFVRGFLSPFCPLLCRSPETRVFGGARRDRTADLYNAIVNWTKTQLFELYIKLLVFGIVVFFPYSETREGVA